MLTLVLSSVAEGASRTLAPSIGAPPALTTWIPPLLMVIGVTLLGILLILAMWNRKRSAIHSAGAQAATSSAANERLHAARQQVQDVHGMATDLLNEAQRLSTGLDHKATHVKELLAQAELRIAEMTALIQNSDRISYRRQPTPSGTTTVEAKLASTESETDNADDPVAAAIYRLSDSGRRPIEIARELREQVGKVELILALRDQ